MEIKVFLALPTNRGLKAETLDSLMKLVALSQPDILVSSEGFNTAENRTWLAAQAIKRGATHIFWVDDDMVYEENTLERLLAHNKDIVGAKYANRKGDGDVVEYLKEKEGDLIKVKSLGGGCVLTKADVFKKIPQPWFWYKINPTGSVQMSHDWWFCEKSRESGYDIWLDNTIKPKHICQKTF